MYETNYFNKNTTIKSKDKNKKLYMFAYPTFRSGLLFIILYMFNIYPEKLILIIDYLFSKWKSSSLNKSEPFPVTFK